MVNRQTRDPGQLLSFNATGQISGDVPNFAVDTGGAARALAAVGASLSGELMKLAGEAAVREETLNGLASIGQQSAASYLRQQAVGEQAASARPSRSVQAPGEIRKLVSEAARRHGVDPAALLKVAEIESSFNPRAKNPRSSAGGLFQFIDSTAKQYGLTDRYDPVMAADAGARLMRDNAAYLRAKLGREASPGELYLAHQQGAGGAAKLLANPNASAASIVGGAAVRLNGGKAGMTAGEFANLWIKKAGGQGATLPATAGGGRSGGVSIPETPLQLRRDGTISGEAYDRAAINAYSWRLDQGISNDLMAAHEELKDDPAAFRTRLAEIHDTYLQDESFADPQMREAFEKTFATRAQTYMLDVADRQGQRLAAEEKAATGEALEARRMDLERQAYTLGANPDADAILAEQGERTMRAIDGAVAAGTLTPAEAANRRKDIATSVARGRIQGTFAALETPEEKERFALGLLDEWATGAGPLAALDFDQVKALSDTLYGQARRDGNQMTAATLIEQSRLERLIADDVAAMQETGTGLDPARSGLDAAKVERALGPEMLVAWQEKRALAQQVWSALNGMEGQDATALAERLAALEPKRGEPGFAERKAIHETAAARAREVLEERTKDPLGQAMRAGVVDVQPLDFTSGESLGESLKARAAAAADVAGLYGVPARYFLPGEQERLSAALYDRPEFMPALTTGIVSAFGKKAPAVLAEISDAAPVLAHAAGLTIATGNASLAEDVARVLTARKDKTYTAKMPADGKFRVAATPVIGEALAGLAKTQSALVSTAMLLYEQAANQQGFDPSEIDEQGTAANSAWAAALDRAAGGRAIGGVKYGGIIEVNGHKTVAPPDMPAEAVGRLWDGLTMGDLAVLPPIGSGNSSMVQLYQLKRGRLVASGDGTYRVALGDPFGDDPQWVSTPDGRFWEIDMRQLAQIKAGR